MAPGAETSLGRPVGCSIPLATTAFREGTALPGLGPAPGDSNPGAATPEARNVIPEHVLGQLSSDKGLTLQADPPGADPCGMIS